MPMPIEITVRLEAEGLVGTDKDGKDVPVGILRDGKPMLLLRHWEDEQENCEHCGGLMTIGACDDEDNRCGRCDKSHLECEGCNRRDAEVCSGCEENWCEECWGDTLHAEDCTNAKPKEQE